SRYSVGRRYATQPAVDHPPVNHRERYRDGGAGIEKVAIGYSLPGHLAEYMLITEETIAADCLLPLPSDSIPFFAGALCEPLSCVISAQDRHIHIHQKSPTAPRIPQLGLLRGGVAVVIGAGPMGQMHAEAALRFSPSHLIVMDIIEERLAKVRASLAEKARQAGTELHAVLSAEGLALIKQVSNGKGADDIIAAVGIRNVQQESQQWLAKGGVLNLFGGLKRGEHMIELDTLRVHYDEIRLCGSSGGSPADLVEALRMVASGEFNPGLHLDMVGSLDQFSKALELIKAASVEGKIVLYPQIPSMDLLRVKAWTLRDETDFLKSRRKA
ncbi:MAG: zinc-binding dehydrogenase, partial [Kiritimatiellae bacterium]|nr:zinc-binding dehydrogenase [Kiritimatiellia bacterium]